MKFDKIDIRNILIGIISSLLVVNIFGPAFDYIGNKVFTISALFFKSYNNTLYQRIALRDYSLDNLIYMYLFMFFLLIIIGTIIIYHFKSKDFLNVLNKFENELDEFSKEKNEADESMNNILNKIEVEKDRIKLLKIKTKKDDIITKIIYIVIFTFIIFIQLLQYSTEVIIKNKINTYENTMRVISPYISNYDIRYFESKFVQIKNKEDYYSLKDEINDILIENGLMIIWK
jgi:hypothetical protein